MFDCGYILFKHHVELTVVHIHVAIILNTAGPSACYNKSLT